MQKEIKHIPEEIIKGMISDETLLIRKLKEYGSVKAKEKGKYSCVYCGSKDGLSVTDKGEGYFHNCFSCHQGGTIFSLIIRKENLNYPKAIKHLANELGIDLPNIKGNIPTAPRVDKNKVVEFYDNKVKEAISQGDTDKAFELSCEADREANKNYFINFKYLDDRNNPLKIWENLETVLDKENIYAVYNQISKDNEILGLDCEGLSNQIMDIHSMANKYGFKVPIDFIGKSISRIGEKNKYNPVIDYLNECEFNWDEKVGRIKQLCDTLDVPEWFNKDLRNILVTKWLLNTANIPFNNGDSNTEGVLVIQGDQGIGKTTWIKKLIPIYLKTGLELDPSDKDKIYNCIKYWVCELGELDATMKSDQAKLKAFLTESIDEIRRPYAIAPERYPRKTAFYGTVNKAEFLKDETGDRRYWVIPVENINIDDMKEIDINQLWGEVMHLLKSNIMELRLTKDEQQALNISNSDFRTKGALQIAVENGFMWADDKRLWKVKSSSEIASLLGLKTTSGLKEVILSLGGEYKRTKTARGYLVPPLRNIDNAWNNI